MFTSPGGVGMSPMLLACSNWWQVLRCTPALLSRHNRSGQRLASRYACGPELGDRVRSLLLFCETRNMRMKGIHPNLGHAAVVALSCALMGAGGCSHNQSGINNPFLAPDRVPPPST